MPSVQEMTPSYRLVSGRIEENACCTVDKGMITLDNQQLFCPRLCTYKTYSSDFMFVDQALSVLVDSGELFQRKYFRDFLLQY